MKELSIVNIKNELRTDSRLLAGFLDHRHRTIVENIDKYLTEMTQLGNVPFETERLKTERLGERVHRFALLNEDQCFFLLTLMRNNPKVVAAKLALVKAFRSARAQLAERDLARVDGKQARRSETDSIKKLVEYASAQGSKSAERYYSNVTQMTNKILGIESGQRDALGLDELKHIAAVEQVVDIAIRDGIKAELPYKDIFQLAKQRAIMMIPALGR